MKGIQFAIERTTSQVESILIKPNLKLTSDIFQISFGKFCLQALHIAELIISHCNLQKHVVPLFQKLLGKLKESRSYKPSCQQQQQESSLPIQNDEIYQFMNARKPISDPKNIAQLSWYADHMLKKQKDTSLFMEYISTVKAPNYSQSKTLKIENKCTQTDLIWIKNLIMGQNCLEMLESLLASIPAYVDTINNKDQRCKTLQEQLLELNKKYMEAISGIEKEEQKNLLMIKQENQLIRKQMKGKNMGMGNNKNKKKNQGNFKRGTFCKQKQRQKQIQKDSKHKEKDKQSKIKNLLPTTDYQFQQNRGQGATESILTKQSKYSSSKGIDRPNLNNSLSINSNGEITNLKYLKKVEFKNTESQTQQTHGDKVIQKQNYSKAQLLLNTSTSKQIPDRFSIDDQFINSQLHIQKRIQRGKQSRIEAGVWRAIERGIERDIENKRNMKYDDKDVIQTFTKKQIEQQSKSRNKNSMKQRDKKNNSFRQEKIHLEKQNIDKDLSFRNTYHNSSSFSNIFRMTKESKQNQIDSHQKQSKINIDQQVNNRQNCLSNGSNHLEDGHPFKTKSSFHHEKIKINPLSNKFTTRIKPSLPNIITNSNVSKGSQTLPNIYMMKQQKMIFQRQNEGELLHLEQKEVRVQDQNNNNFRQQQQILKLIGDNRNIQSQIIKQDKVILQKIGELQKTQKGNPKEIDFYIQLLEKVHRRFCGKQCKHLQRYYKQIKNGNSWNNRIALNLPTRKIGFFS